jgi:isoleucyl-tRNA synthetase
MIEANEAIERIGADVMRWMYCEQVPSQNINFGYRPANEVKRRLLTFWNSVKFFVDYANVEGFRPETDPAGEVMQPLDRWLLARTEQLVVEVTAAYERFWTPDVTRSFEAFVDDLSNWYIRRSRRRFWHGGDTAALRTLWQALVRSVQVIAPVMPFLADSLWRVLRSEEDPSSVFLAVWPKPGERDEELLAEVAEVRRIVELGRQARAASGLKLRQPLRRLVVQGADAAQRLVEEIGDELRVKEVEFGPVEAAEFSVKPNLPLLGPRLGSKLAEVRRELQEGHYEQLDGGRIFVAGEELAPDEVLVERSSRAGWAVAEDDGLAVALSTEVDAELRLEGRVLDLIHRLNSLRKEAGLQLTDRIVVTLPETESDLLQHADWIKDEVLAVQIDTGGGTAEPTIALA